MEGHRKEGTQFILIFITLCLTDRRHFMMILFQLLMAFWYIYVPCFIRFPQLHFFMVRRPSSGPGLIIVETSRSHADIHPPTHTHRHSVELLWTSDQPVAETSTWQHTTPTRERHPCPCGIRTRSLSKRAVADPRLRPRGQWDRLVAHNVCH